MALPVPSPGPLEPAPVTIATLPASLVDPDNEPSPYARTRAVTGVIEEPHALR